MHAVCTVHCFAGLAARVPSRKRSALRATSDARHVVDDFAAITRRGDMPDSFSGLALLSCLLIDTKFSSCSSSLKVPRYKGRSSLVKSSWRRLNRISNGVRGAPDGRKSFIRIKCRSPQ